MQQYITMNGVKIKQPDELMQFSFSTTYSEDTTRVQTGELHATALFTVEQYSYKATGLTVDEMKTILQIISKGQNFELHYFSPYYGVWRDAPFYVGQGSLVVRRLNEDSEFYDSISFNMQGVNPL